MPSCDIQKQPPPLPVVDEATIKARATAARAYALSASPDFTTPPITTKATTTTTTTTTATATATATAPSVGEQQQQQQQLFIPHIQDEDYALFVKSLVDDEFFNSLPMDDEDFDLDLLAEEEDDDDDDDDEEDDDDDDHAKTASAISNRLKSPSQVGNNSDDDDDDDDDEPFTLQTELGLLLEEDLEAAITTLLSQHPPTPDNNKTLSSSNNNNNDNNNNNNNNTCDNNNTTTPRTSPDAKATVTTGQVSRLKSMLQKHYQLLVQQAVLCVRSAQAPLHKSYISESKEDLVEILDGAVGMLQDLDQVSVSLFRFVFVFVCLVFIILFNTVKRGFNYCMAHTI
jgi:hypothetical protein